MNPEKDYYAVLGVSKTATTDQIKKAYRKIALKDHPDRNPGNKTAEDRFKEASEANDILSDPEKRKQYDEMRALVGSGGFRMPPGGARGAPGGFTFNLDDLLGQGDFSGSDLGGLFGRGARSGSRRGQDLHADLSLDFDSAFRGGEVPLTITSPATCRTCRGTRARPGSSLKQCPNCAGRGIVSRNQGAFGFSEPCRQCAGTGTLIESPCPDCGGSGQTTQTNTIKVRIPPGVNDGARIRLKGKGGPGEHNAPAGDLLVDVHVRGHRLFTRSGDDLTLTVPITFAEAAIGAKITVPTMDGPVTIKVPAGLQRHTLRVRGRGVRRRDGHTGDLLVKLEVAVPSKLTQEERTAIEELERVSQADPRPHITEAVKS